MAPPSRPSSEQLAEHGVWRVGGDAVRLDAGEIGGDWIPNWPESCWVSFLRGVLSLSVVGVARVLAMSRDRALVLGLEELNPSDDVVRTTCGLVNPSKPRVSAGREWTEFGQSAPLLDEFGGRCRSAMRLLCAAETTLARHMINPTSPVARVGKKDRG
jgi:hypothetical protein